MDFDTVKAEFLNVLPGKSMRGVGTEGKGVSWKMSCHDFFHAIEPIVLSMLFDVNILYLFSYYSLLLFLLICFINICLFKLDEINWKEENILNCTVFHTLLSCLCCSIILFALYPSSIPYHNQYVIDYDRL